MRARKAVPPAAVPATCVWEKAGLVEVSVREEVLGGVLGKDLGDDRDGGV
jgi:hypothetical protein